MLTVKDVCGIDSARTLSAAIMQLRASFLGQEDGWRSLTVEDYLEAMSAWLEDAEQSEMLDGSSPEAWRMVARVLAAGSVYE